METLVLHIAENVLKAPAIMSLVQKVIFRGVAVV